MAFKLLKSFLPIILTSHWNWKRGLFVYNLFCKPFSLPENMWNPVLNSRASPSSPHICAPLASANWKFVVPWRSLFPERKEQFGRKDQWLCFIVSSLLKFSCNTIMNLNLRSTNTKSCMRLQMLENKMFAFKVKNCFNDSCKTNKTKVRCIESRISKVTVGIYMNLR